MKIQHFCTFLAAHLWLCAAPAWADGSPSAAARVPAAADASVPDRPILGAELGALWLANPSAGMAPEVMRQLGMNVDDFSQSMGLVSPALTQEWRVLPWFTVLLRQQLGFLKLRGSLEADPRLTYRLARYVVPIHTMAQLHLPLVHSTEATLAAGLGVTYIYNEETGHFGQQTSHHLPFSAGLKFALWRHLPPYVSIGISYSASWTTLPAANPLWSDGGENLIESASAAVRMQL